MLYKQQQWSVLWLALCGAVFFLAGCEMLLRYELGASSDSAALADSTTGLDSTIRPDSAMGPDGTIGPDLLSDGSTDAQVYAPGFVSLPPDTFWMGRKRDTEPCSSENEVGHQVTLTHSFEIGITEVTQRMFSDVMGYNPAQNTINANNPIESLTWEEAAAYCNALSEQYGLEPCYDCNPAQQPIICNVPSCAAAGYVQKADIYNCRGYRLPTEAEWEYAYGADLTESTYNGTITDCQTDTVADQIGWYENNAQMASHIVGAKLANKWGLFDMAGNVNEMVHDGSLTQLPDTAVTDPAVDCATDGEHIYKGGGYRSPAGELRAAFRDSRIPASSPPYWFGFRCARTLF